MAELTSGRMVRELDAVEESAGFLPAVFGGRTAPAARTLVDVLDATVLIHPHEPALDDGRTALSYRELAAEVDGLRRRLASAGIGVGDRVGCGCPPAPMTSTSAFWRCSPRGRRTYPWTPRIRTSGRTWCLRKRR